MARTRLSAKGQMVLPKRIREQLGWRQGQELEVEREGDGVVVRPASGVREDWLAWIERWSGFLKGTNALEEHEAEHRAEIEADERWEREHGR